MNAKEWADTLNGRGYRGELSREEEKHAKQDRVLIVFGASDDLIEFRGIFTDETGCYNGGTLHVTPSKLIPEHDCDDCECEYCGYRDVIANAAEIDAKWDHNGYSWYISAKVQHATFEILEDGDKYCRGIVIEEKHLLRIEVPHDR